MVSASAFRIALRIRPTPAWVLRRSAWGAWVRRVLSAALGKRANSILKSSVNCRMAPPRTGPWAMLPGARAMRLSPSTRRAWAFQTCASRRHRLRPAAQTSSAAASRTPAPGDAERGFAGHHPPDEIPSIAPWSGPGASGAPALRSIWDPRPIWGTGRKRIWKVSSCYSPFQSLKRRAVQPPPPFSCSPMPRDTA